MFTESGGIGGQFLNEAFANSPSMSGSAEAYRDQANRMGGSDLAAAGRTAQAIGGATEASLLDNPQAAEAATIRGAYEKFLGAGNSWASGDVMSMAQYDFATGVQKNDASDYLGGVLRPAAEITSPASDESRRAADILEQLLGQTIEINQRQQRAIDTQPVAPNGDRPLTQSTFDSKSITEAVASPARPAQY